MNPASIPVNLPNATASPVNLPNATTSPVNLPNATASPANPAASPANMAPNEANQTINVEQVRSDVQEIFIKLNKPLKNYTDEDIRELWTIRFVQLKFKHGPFSVEAHDVAVIDLNHEKNEYNKSRWFSSSSLNPTPLNSTVKVDRYLPLATKDMNCYSDFNKAREEAKKNGYPDIAVPGKMVPHGMLDLGILKYLIKMYRDKKKALVCFIAVKQDETDAKIDEMSQQPEPQTVLGGSRKSNRKSKRKTRKSRRKSKRKTNRAL
jgi:hypothetical protein